MREIKFRAWVGEMVQVKMIDWDGKTFNDKPCIMDQRNDIWPMGDDYECILEQFTGLMDKNGREIYEGDIDPRYGVVVFDHGSFGFLDKDTHGHDSILILPWARHDIEIIGNIHENPELLTNP